MKKSIFSTLIILFAISLYFAVSAGVENTARMQNNFNLDSVTYCLETAIETHGNSKENFTSALNICAKNQRSMGITGDIFVIRQSDRKFFWDASLDCVPENDSKNFMVADGICSIFNKPGTCLVAVEYMLHNPPKGNLKWDFDDSTEMLNYRYLKTKIEGEQYIITQGAQTDEANSQFLLTYILIAIGSIILIVVTGY